MYIISPIPVSTGILLQPGKGIEETSAISHGRQGNSNQQFTLSSLGFSAILSFLTSFQ
jgi:preprotein translocase subunit SecG